MAAQIEGGNVMCFTTTVNLINFDELSPTQKKQLDELKQKLQARKEALQKRVDEIGQGLQKLDQKLNG
jgi:hypothetical protein